MNGNDAPEDEPEDITSARGRSAATPSEQPWLTTLQLIGLTIGLAGAQLTWTVEMA